MNRLFLVIRIGVVATFVTAMALIAVRLGADERAGGYQSRVYAIKDATVVTAPGKTIEKGTIVVRDGIIAAVATDAAIPSDAEVIDATGLTAYAGFIDAFSTNGVDGSAVRSDTGAGRTVNFSEDALAATHADNRKGLTPEFQVSRALSVSDSVADSWRRAGFTARLVAPSGGIAAGQSALVSLSGLPRREILLKTPVALHVAWDVSGSGYPGTLMGMIAHLRQAMLDAKHYQDVWRAFEGQAPGVNRPPVDAALAELGRALRREEPTWFAANSRDEIHRALDFAQEFNLQPVIYGGREAIKAIDRLKQMSVPVVLRLDFPQAGSRGGRRTSDPSGDSSSRSAAPGSSAAALAGDVKLHEPVLPSRVEEDQERERKEIVRTAAALHQAGVLFAFSTEGSESPSKFYEGLRKLLEEQLSAEIALAALTTQPAKLLASDARLGTIEPGKLAHLSLWSGNFHDAKSHLRYVFLDGRKFEFKKDSTPERPAADLAKLAGTWFITIEASDGTTAAELVLNPGESPAGTFRSDHGEGRVSEWKQSGDDVSFVVEIGAGAKSLRLQFQGKHEQGRLNGSLRSSFGGETKWQASRDAKPQPEPKDTKTAQAGGRRTVASELESDRKPPLQTGGNLLIRGATVLTVTKGTIENGSILVRDGKIAEVGTGLNAPEGFTTIDGTGLFVAPGIIDTHSHMAISGGVNESTLSIVPEVRIRDVVQSDDVSIYRALAGGTTAARLLHGSANVVGGQDAVIKLRWGKPAQELLLHDNPQGVKFALGENVTRTTGRFPNSRMGVEATLVRAFSEAQRYRDDWARYTERKQAAAKEEKSDLSAGPEPRRDLRLEALAQVLDGRIRVHSHCYRADEILMLLRVAQQYGIRVQSLQHVLEGYKVASEIAAHGASCSTFSDWWAYKIEAFDAIPYNAALMRDAGVSVVIKSDSDDLIRRLYAEAAKMLRYGALPEQDALAMVTINAARELGLESRMGSIEVGKDADLAIYNGHPLNMFSRVEMTLVDGEIYFARSDSAAFAAAGDRPQAHTLPPTQRAERIAMPAAGAKRYAIRNADIYPVHAAPISRGTLVIEADRVLSVTRGGDVPADATVIEADGLSVYPGMIDAGSVLGLYEVGSLRETQDFREGGSFQPDLLAATALHPDSELIPVARAGGVLSVLTRPRGGRVSGQSVLANLAGWVPREMVVEPAVALHVQWPTHESAAAWKRLDDKAKNERRDARRKEIAELADLFRRAREYYRVRAAMGEQSHAVVFDPRLESLRPYLEGKRPVVVEANRASEIEEAIDFAQQQGLKLIIEGGADAWKVATRLKESSVPVSMGPVTRLPLEEFDPYDAVYSNAAKLHAAGVKFCIRSDTPTNARNLPFEAAMAVAYGLPADEALKAVTIYPAEILGVADRLGSIDSGKLANLIITDGNPLQPATQIHGVFVAGRPFAPTSRHTQLYDRYKQRLQEIRSGQAKMGVDSEAKTASN